MEETKILILGVKEWPYGSSANYEKHVGGGTGKYVTAILKHFNNENIKSIIVTRKFPTQNKYEKITDKLEIYRVPFIGGAYLRVPSFYLSAFLSSYSILNNEKIDIIYAHGIFATCLALLLSKRFNVPIVSRPAGLAFTIFKQPIKSILKIMEKVIYPKADTIVFLSEDEKKKFKKLLDEQFDNSVVIPTGIDVTDCEIKKQNDTLKLVFVGRLVPVKGIDYLIKSFALLPTDMNIECTIVGDGRERNNLENLANKLSVTNKFKFVGFKEDVYTYLSESDIFVLPSFSEGLPIALLEAMSMKLACIVTDIGLPFPDDTILKVAVKDEKELATAIIKLYNNIELRMHLGENAKSYVKEHHSWNNAINSYLMVFDELLNKE